MLKKLKVPFIALLFAATTSLVQADEATDNPAIDNLDRLMNLSGLTSSIAAVPQTIDLEMDEQSLSSQMGDPELAGNFAAAMKSTMTKERFTDAMKGAISNRLTEAEIDQLLSWYETPLGKKVAVIHQTDQFVVAQRVKSGERLTLTPKRQTLIEKFDQVVMGSDNMKIVSMVSATAVGHSMMKSMGMPVSVGQVRQMIAPQMEAESVKIVDEFKASLAFTYQPLTDAELDEFITSMVMPEHTIFNDAMWSGMATAFSEGGEALGAILAGELNGAF